MSEENGNEADIRAQIESEVFDGAADEQSPAKTSETQETASTPDANVKTEETPDPWATVPEVIKTEFFSMRDKVAALDKLESRLKGNEQRLGALINEQKNAAYKAANAADAAPSKAQIDAAAGDQEALNELKEVWPEWGEVYEKHLSAENKRRAGEYAALQSKMDDFQRKYSEESAKNTAITGGAIVALRHPDWTQKSSTPEFQKWHAEQGKKDSFDPLEVIAILDEYDTHIKQSQKEVRNIANERKERLAQSQIVPGHKLPPQKSEADMTEQELRASVAKEVYGADA